MMEIIALKSDEEKIFGNVAEGREYTSLVFEFYELGI